MFSERQKKLLEILETGNFSGNELANKLGISRRTVVREIKEINSYLQKDKIGIIYAKNIYRLKILQKSKFYSILNSSIPDKYILLFNLLVHAPISIDDLSSLSLLSRKNILQNIKLLNNEYSKAFNIQMIQGKGINIDFELLNRVDLIASLLQRFPDFINIVNGDALDDKSINVKKYLEMILPVVDQMSEYITKFEIEQQIKAMALLKFSGNSKIHEPLIVTIKNFYMSKSELYSKLVLQKDQILTVIKRCLLRYKVYNFEITNLIYFHLLRSAVFPIVFSKLPASQKNEIQISNPLSFDLTNELRTSLNESFPQVYLNNSFLVLYSIMAFKNQSRKSKQKILLLSNSNALGSINKMLLEQMIKNTACTLKVNSSLCGDEKYDLVIMNGNIDPLSNANQADYIFDGILDKKDTEKIQLILSDKFYGNICRTELKKDQILSYSESTSDYFCALTTCLESFCNNSKIVEEDRSALLNREREGNQLTIGSAAIPHIISRNIEQPYVLLTIFLQKEVIIKSQRINTILIVLVNQDVKDKGGIFKYLYSRLNKISNENRLTKEKLLEAFY